MRKNAITPILVAAGIAAILSFAACAMEKTPTGPSLALDLNNPASLITETNRAFLFNGLNNLDGFSKEPWTAVDYEGAVENLDGEHLFIWVTNALRSHGGGWFYGGWAKTYDPYLGTNLLGPVSADKVWTMLIKVRSTNGVGPNDNIFLSRCLNLQINATNNAEKTKGSLSFTTPTIVPTTDSVYFLGLSSFSRDGTMSTAREVLQHVTSIKFLLDNNIYADKDSFGFIIDYIIIGVR